MQKLIAIINNPPENKPHHNDKRWRKSNNIKNIYVIPGKKKYRITDSLIELMKRYSKLYEDNINNINDSKIIHKKSKDIAVIFKLINRRTNEKYIGYTTNNLITYIKLNLHLRNIGQPNIFDSFNVSNLTDLKFKMLEYVKFKKRKDLIQRKLYYKNKYKKVFAPIKRRVSRTPVIKVNNTGTKSKNTKVKSAELLKLEKDIDQEELYNKRMDVFYNVFNKFKNYYESFTGYIYLLKNKKNHLCLIGGTKKKVDKKEFVIKMLKNNNMKLEEDLKNKDPFSFKLIEKFKAKCEWDFMLRLDFLKLKYNSISRGYNSNLTMPESENLFSNIFPTRLREETQKILFLQIQKDLFNKNFHDKDKSKYQNIYGFIYMIENKVNRKKYFAHYMGGGTLKDVIMELYNKAAEPNIKHNKILKVLAEEPFYDFDFQIIKIKKHSDMSIDLKDETDKLIEEFDTINNGYNLDYRRLKQIFAISSKMQKID